MSHIVVQQLPADWDAVVARKKRNAAFEDWRKRLSKGDRLPRGRFFIGKSPGCPRIRLWDEAWMYMSEKAAPRSGMSFTHNALTLHQLGITAKAE